MTMNRTAMTGMFTAFALLLTGCQSAGTDESSTDTKAVDDGSEITMWTRSPTATFSQTLIDAYNAGHKNKVKLTVIPADSYQQKVGTAAGSRAASRRAGHRRGLRAQLRLQGVVPGPHRPGRRAAVQVHPGAGAHEGRDLPGQGLRRAARHRPLRGLLQQEAVHQGRPRPGEATHHPRRALHRRAEDRRPRRWRRRLLLRRLLPGLHALHHLADGLGLRADRAQRPRARPPRSPTRPPARDLHPLPQDVRRGTGARRRSGARPARPGSRRSAMARSASSRWAPPRCRA